MSSVSPESVQTPGAGEGADSEGAESEGEGDAAEVERRMHQPKAKRPRRHGRSSRSLPAWQRERAPESLRLATEEELNVLHHLAFLSPPATPSTSPQSPPSPGSPVAMVAAVPGDTQLTPASA